MLRVSAQEPIHVKQAVLADPADFQFDTSMEQAIGGLGETMMDIGKELRQRKIDATNSLSEARARQQMSITQAQIADHKVQNPNWDEESIQKIINDNQKIALSFGGDKKTQAVNQMRWQGFAEVESLGAKAAVTMREIDADVETNGTLFIKDFSEDPHIVDENGNHIPGIPLEESTTALMKSLGRKYADEEIPAVLRGYEIKAQQGRVDQLLLENRFDEARIYVEKTKYDTPGEKLDANKLIDLEESNSQKANTDARKDNNNNWANNLLSHIGDPTQPLPPIEDVPYEMKDDYRVVTGRLTDSNDGLMVDQSEPDADGKTLFSRWKYEIMTGDNKTESDFMNFLAEGGTVPQMNELREINKSTAKLTKVQRQALSARMTSIRGYTSRLQGLMGDTLTGSSRWETAVETYEDTVLDGLLEIAQRDFKGDTNARNKAMDEYVEDAYTKQRDDLYLKRWNSLIARKGLTGLRPELYDIEDYGEQGQAMVDLFIAEDAGEQTTEPDELMELIEYWENPLEPEPEKPRKSIPYTPMTSTIPNLKQ
jgi:hypothetical protein